MMDFRGSLDFIVDPAIGKIGNELGVFKNMIQQFIIAVTEYAVDVPLVAGRLS